MPKVSDVATQIEAFFLAQPGGELTYTSICAMCECTEHEARRGLALARKKRGLSVESYSVFVRKVDTSNPWGLTPREAETMTTVISTGGCKQAARKLGIAHSTVKDTTARAGMKMGLRQPPTAKYHAWDRWQRGVAKESA
jgi:DNA-binding NarL/FixJ family response regulator